MHKDSRLQAYMTKANGFHIYVGDIVEYISPGYGLQLGKIAQFYEKVISTCIYN